jgi:soluble lytic murein transglycosylase-like protein
MQVLPSTGRGLSKSLGRELDLLDTQDNITAGVLLLKQLVRATGSNDKALAGYYQGLGSIARAACCRRRRRTSRTSTRSGPASPTASRTVRLTGRAGQAT